MMILNTLNWGTDESFTSSQVVERDGRRYLRHATYDTDGNVVDESLTPAENVQAAANGSGSQQ